MTRFARQVFGLISLSVMAVLAMAVPSAQADFLDNIYTEGHADITVEYDGTGSEFRHVYNFEGATVNGSTFEGQIESTDVTTVVPESSALGRPGGSEWDPIGTGAGEDVFILPAGQQSGVPFLGWSSELISSSDFPDGIVFEFEGLSGPGEFSAWTFDISGNPDFVMSSFSSDDDDNEGITFNNAGPGNHAHFNLGFTELGSYQVDFRVTGINTNVTSVGTYRFDVGGVIPEPSSLTLMGLGLGAVLFGGSLYARRKPSEERS